MPHVSLAKALALAALTVPLTAFPARAQLPQVQANEITVPEGDAGSTDAVLTVSLSAAADGVVTVAYATEPAENRPATAGASCGGNTDYVTESGTVQFNPGQTSRPLGVAVCGDTAFEENERFRIRLSNPVGATIGDATGRVTITNNDAEPITVSVRDTTIPESDLGTPEGKYTLTLSRSATETVRVDLAVRGGTATFGSGCTGGADFRSVQGGSVEFAPGQTSRQLSFAICSDLNAESDEAFSVTLARPTGAVLGDAVGQVTIKNDDIAGSVVPRDDDVVIRVDPARAELVVELVALATQTAPNLGFGVRARNTGAVAASNVPVRFQLPKDVAFAGLEENTMGTCTQNSTSADGALQVNCTAPSIPAGGNRGVRVLGKTPDSAIAGSTEVVYSATIDPGNTVVEGNETNNLTLGRATVLTPADLRVVVNALTLTGRGGGLSLAGKTIVDFPCIASDAELGVSLTVRNLGPNRTPGMGLVASWPGGFANSGAACFEFCAVPALNSGQSATIALAGLWKEEGRFASGDVRFRLDAAFDPASGNNTATLGLSKAQCGG